jgi:phage terminase large subunit-like protein
LSTNPTYIPTPVGYHFHKSQMKTRLLLGGNRSSKSHTGAAEAVMLSAGCHPWKKMAVPNLGWVSTLDFSMGRDIIRPKIEEFLKMFVGREGRGWRFIKRDNQYKLSNGSIIIMKSADSGKEKYQAAGVDWIWMDEEHSKEIYGECEPRLVDRGGLIWLTMTPLSGKTYIYDTFIENDKKEDMKGGPIASLSKSLNIETLKIDSIAPRTVGWENAKKRQALFKASMLDNYNPQTLTHNLAVIEVAEIVKKLEGTSLYNARIWGDFVSLEGLVYPQFGTHNVIKPMIIPEDWHIYGTADWGFNAYNAFLFEAYAPDKRKYICGEVVRNLCTTDEFLEGIKNHPLFPRLKRSIGDPNSPEKIMAARKMGIDMVKGKKKDILDTISKVQEELLPKPAKPHLYIFDDCKHTLTEFKTYSWKKVKVKDSRAKDVPEDFNNDCLDAHRNLTSFNFPFPKGARTDVLVQLSMAQIEQKRVWKVIGDRKKRVENQRKEHEKYMRLFGGFL